MIATVAFVALAAAACAGRGRDLARTPPGGVDGTTILVVDANLTELFDPLDTADTSDLERFADRLKEQLPEAPDVLLLQELRRTSGHKLLAILGERFGTRFHMAFAPGPRIWDGAANEVMHEVAVVINQATMKTLDTSALINRYPVRQATPPGLATEKLVGIAHLRRKGGQTLVVASLHFPPDRSFLESGAGEPHRARWAERIAARVVEMDPDAVHVVAGDFNSPRCLNHTWRDCDLAAWWEALVREPNPIPDARQVFKDRVGWRHAPRAGVDHIFTDGYVWNYETDDDYLKDESDYYSDHRFRWVLVGQPPHER